MQKKKFSLKTEYLSVLKKLQQFEKSIEAKELSKQMNLKYEKLMSGAVYSLKQVELADFSEKEKVIYTLSKEGKKYLKKGLPERQIFKLFNKNNRKEVKIHEFSKEVEEKLGFNKKMFFIGLSNMKRNKWVVSSKAMGKEQIFIYNQDQKTSDVEKMLQLFEEKESYTLEEIPKNFNKTQKTLYKRKLLKKDKTTIRYVKLTELGKNIKEKDIKLITDEILLIKNEMLKNGEWKENLFNLKKYQLDILGPRKNMGKMHPISIIVNEIREIFHSMGFEEIRGPIVEEAFYNFDSLFQPQDHPAREMHDTFYLKNPEVGKLPNKKFVESIKNTHENGGSSGSKGWKYKWSKKIAQKLLLRTHTTATTIRQLSKITKEDLDNTKKFFCVDTVFRNENVDRTHLAEFMQIDGIVIGKNLNLSDLIGQIVEFYKRMGFDKVVTRPGFFPYTEPSMEIAVYSEDLGAWLEMGGSGIFRPEVTYPWGIKEPYRVLAWGLGIERLAMLKLKRKDIRDLYQSPISWLREVSY